MIVDMSNYYLENLIDMSIKGAKLRSTGTLEESDIEFAISKFGTQINYIRKINLINNSLNDFFIEALNLCLIAL